MPMQFYLLTNDIHSIERGIQYHTYTYDIYTHIYDLYMHMHMYMYMHMYMSHTETMKGNCSKHIVVIKCQIAMT